MGRSTSKIEEVMMAGKSEASLDRSVQLRGAIVDGAWKGESGWRRVRVVAARKIEGG